MYVLNEPYPYYTDPSSATRDSTNLQKTQEYSGIRFRPFSSLSRSFPGPFLVLSRSFPQGQGWKAGEKLFYGAVAEDKKGNTKLNWFWLEMPGNPGDDVTILDSPKK